MDVAEGDAALDVGARQALGLGSDVDQRLRVGEIDEGCSGATG